MNESGYGGCGIDLCLAGDKLADRAVESAVSFWEYGGESGDSDVLSKDVELRNVEPHSFLGSKLQRQIERPFLANSTATKLPYLAT